jgi:hypothetical protein
MGKCLICGSDEGTAGCTQQWRHAVIVRGDPSAPYAEIIALRARVAALEKERDAAQRFMVSSETAYCGSAIMREVLGFFEAAGYGKPGTPNTLWAMSQEAIAKAQAAESAESALSSAREEREKDRDAFLADIAQRAIDHDAAVAAAREEGAALMGDALGVLEILTITAEAGDLTLAARAAYEIAKKSNIEERLRNALPAPKERT